MLSERIYRLLLNVYPRKFRADFGESCIQLFHDQVSRVTTPRELLTFWRRVVLDVITSAPACQRDRLIEVWGECMQLRKRFAICLALALTCAGAAGTKLSSIDAQMTSDVAWPLSLAYDLTYKTTVDAIVLLTAYTLYLVVLGQLKRDALLRGVAFALPVLAVGRVAYYITPVLINLPSYGPAYTARYMLQWLPLFLSLILAMKAVSEGRSGRPTHRAALSVH